MFTLAKYKFPIISQIQELVAITTKKFYLFQKQINLMDLRDINFVEYIHTRIHQAVLYYHSGILLI